MKETPLIKKRNRYTHRSCHFAFPYAVCSLPPQFIPNSFADASLNSVNLPPWTKHTVSRFLYVPWANHPTTLTNSNSMPVQQHRPLWPKKVLGHQLQLGLGEEKFLWAMGIFCLMWPTLRRRKQSN